MSIAKKLASAVVCRVVGRVFNLTRGVFPRSVRIETTSACNAQCVICPHRRMKRPVGRMSDELYTQLIDECAAHDCHEVHLHNFGEPLMDKALEERIRYAKSKGVRRVKAYSNGSLLNEQRAVGLIEAGLDEINISFDGATKEEFESIRVPLKFDEVVKNVRRLVTLRNERQSGLRIRVGCCSTSDRQKTMDTLAGMVDEFSFGKIHNWTDNPDLASPGGVRKPCSRLWRTFTVLANGDVSLCCLDYDGQSILGHVDRDHSIRQVFHSKPYEAVRRLHRLAQQHKIPLCNHCTKSFL
ncbi:MAG: SPASM domain-containing protein [Pirellulales bacterium]|nr:SPASM domain-containing protein [Pirellulales bacterium]